MIDRYLTIQQLAELKGQSRQYVHRLCKQGKLPTTLIDGVTMIDMEDPTVQAFINGVKVPAPEKHKKTKPVGAKKQNKTETAHPVAVVEPKKGKSKEAVIDELDPDLIKMLDAGTLTNEMIVKLPKAWVEKLRIYEQVKQIKQKREQERKTLIAVQSVNLVFGKLYDIDINQFMTIKSKVIPDLAGIFGCTDADKMLLAEKRIDEELWTVLKSIKYEMDKFIESKTAK